ncbi:MAG: PilT protein domain protein [Hyphomicrobiales bacterium]|nr:PilT protein domain protein [Hyphomicrobiales bacterium]
MEEVIAIDTNVLVTFLARRQEPGYRDVARTLSNEMIYIAPTVLLETEWVLRSVYKGERAAVVITLREIVGLPNFTTEGWIATAIEWALTGGVELADAMHLAGAGRADSFFTQDRDFIRRAQSRAAYPPFYAPPADDL